MGKAKIKEAAKITVRPELEVAAEEIIRIIVVAAEGAELDLEVKDTPPTLPIAVVTAIMFMVRTLGTVSNPSPAHGRTSAPRGREGPTSLARKTIK